MIRKAIKVGISVLAKGVPTVNRPAPDRLLMIVMTHLGDACRTLHLARTLNEAGYQLYAVAKPIPAELLRLSGLFKEIHEYEPLWVSRKAGWRNTVKGALAFARWARKNRFSICVVTHWHPFNYVLARLSGAPRRIGHKATGVHLLTDAVEAGAPFGTVEAISALAEPLGLKVRPRWPVEFCVSADAKRFAEKVRQGKRPYIIVHPGAGAPYKCWSPENFALVARKAGRKTVVVHGPGERAIAEKVSFLAGDLPVVGPRSVEELVALLERADLFVGNDAGPSHIAVACGVPTVVAFMQKGKKEVWGYDLPWYCGIEVHQSPDDPSNVLAVVAACKRLWGKRLCEGGR